MPKRTDLKKIMIIGSGPIVIGQAAEFDYAGTQACLSLKEEGYEVILVNSNPATIMTDTSVADKVYMEPLTLEYVARILRKERPETKIILSEPANAQLVGSGVGQERGAENVFDYSLGNPEVEPPEAVIEALRRVAAGSRPRSHGYMPNAGFPEVREAIARRLAGRLAGANLFAP